MTTHYLLTLHECSEKPQTGTERLETVKPPGLADRSELAGQLADLKGEAMSWLRDPNYGPLRIRLENAHAAVEAGADEPGGCQA